MQEISKTATKAFDGAHFDDMASALQAHFDNVVATDGAHLFQVEPDVDLYEVYLNNFPAEHQRYHTCSCCRHFIRRFGALSSINADGTLTPAIWNAEGVPDFYRPVVDALAKAVKRGKVTGIFLSKEPVWGTPVKGEWTHFGIRVPEKLVYRKIGTKTAGQMMAIKRQDFGTLVHGLSEYKLPAIKQALTLIDAAALYRPEKVRGPAQFLFELQQSITARRGKPRMNLVWRATAGAPVGWCQPRSTMIGTLLDDIIEGHDFAEVKRRFDAKMDANNYRRPQAPPKAGNIDRAEKVFDELGLASALERRSARFEDITFKLWTPAPVAEALQSHRLFDHLRPLQPQRQSEPLDMPGRDITWTKFYTTVLPNALKIEVFASGDMNICGLTTAVHADAPPILQWDTESKRNPVNWYFYTNRNQSYPEHWDLRSGTWVNVTAVTLLPSMWNGGFEHHGKGAVLILEGARDMRKGGLAVFPEDLKSSLHEVRATIEAHSQNRQLEGREEGTANGLAVGHSGRRSSKIRVTTAIGTMSYIIDRWD